MAEIQARPVVDLLPVELRRCEQDAVRSCQRWLLNKGPRSRSRWRGESCYVFSAGRCSGGESRHRRLWFASSFLGRPWRRGRKAGTTSVVCIFLSRPAVAARAEGCKRRVIPLPPMETGVVSWRLSTCSLLELDAMEEAGKLGPACLWIGGCSRHPIGLQDCKEVAL
jgi:hypothetical protein